MLQSETIENQTKTDLVSLACGELSPGIYFREEKKCCVIITAGIREAENVATFKCEKKTNENVRKPVWKK